MPIERRRRRGERSSGTGNALPIAAAAVAIVALVGVVALMVWQHMTVVPHDKLSGCPIDGPRAVHAILVDRSDPFTPVQMQRLTQLVEGIAKAAAVDERVDLYVLTAGDGAVASPEVSLCRPRSEGSQWNENPARLRRAFESRYLDTIRQSLINIATPQEAPSSPIMESVKAVCVGAFGALPSK